MGKVLVLYASATGNTELMAETIAEYIRKQNHEVTMKDFDIDNVNANEITKYDTVLLGIYTWTNGELPFEVEDFYEQLDFVDLKGRVFAVFGSGDSFYDVYGGAVDIMYERLRELGAKLVPVRLKVDLEPDQADVERCRELAKQACQMIGESKRFFDK
ncbi:flavodoxin [Oceanobacillus bengalensis]|uniref:Flavodoxin n=1 Tax=Oceanobacillus bengalensis TaxID=1435466 RepID=A0A494Z6P6_9BACI|nr:flavodoxin [Oceanobacillus bengalensis]RKQ18165.1 flavodoxin [Oceanobacillus bengalensis]